MNESGEPSQIDGSMPLFVSQNDSVDDNQPSSPVVSNPTVNEEHEDEAEENANLMVS